VNQVKERIDNKPGGQKGKTFQGKTMELIKRLRYYQGKPQGWHLFQKHLAKRDGFYESVHESLLTINHVWVRWVKEMS
jgi:hypothetical protein